MGKNVMIPLPLLDRIIDMLDFLDISEYSPATRYDYCDILWALKLKKLRVELRESYAKIIKADDLEAWEAARDKYFARQRELLEMSFNNEMPF